MTDRKTAVYGAPCWADLLTTDVDGARAFYGELFGWQAGKPSPDFGGYFMFTRNGVPIAGGIGSEGDGPVVSAWRPYIATDDIAKTLEVAEAEGGKVTLPVTAIADLGSEAGIADPSGAEIRLWQPDSFPGFRLAEQPGLPNWFELHTRGHGAAVRFYTAVFGWAFTTVGDTDEFRYSTAKDPAGDGDVAGVMDATQFLPDGVPSNWGIYWWSDDVAATVDTAVKLGATVQLGPESTPYGCLAALADPAGAGFRLRGPSR